MYYVIYHYKEGRQDLAVKGAAHEGDIINFIHDNYKEIEVHRILEVKAEYRLGLVVTKDYVRSELEPEEETESLVPINKDLDQAILKEAILKENKEKLEEIETEEPSAMEEAAGDIEEETKKDEVPVEGFAEEGLTPEERTKKVLSEADLLIEREKQRQKQKKKGWKLCTKCNSNRVAPWNKKKTCSPCQSKRKTDRPYSRSKEFPGL